jgi:hypothetical protein
MLRFASRQSKHHHKQIIVIVGYVTGTAAPLKSLPQIKARRVKETYKEKKNDIITQLQTNSHWYNINPPFYILMFALPFIGHSC